MRLLSIGCWLGVLLLAGCQKSGSLTPAPRASSPWPGKMILTTAPAPPPSEKDLVFQLHLTGADGAPVAGAKVTAELVMPVMDMGKNEIIFTEKGKGDYEGTGKFTMSGPWNVVITASAPGQSGQQTIPVVVSPQSPGT